jgi:hypothetical protein
MGTSKSSSGSPSGVPMVPPWVPDAEQPQIPPEEKKDEQQGNSVQEAPMPAVAPETLPIAPRARFGPTRTALGDYGSSGSRDSLRRGVGRYISGGLGGSSTAARRFGGTSTTAGALYGALGGAGTGASVDRTTLDRDVLSGKSARQVIDAVIEIACPVDGTQDTEASRNSINDALSELLNRHPDTDLLALTEDQREFVVGQFVSMDVYRRFVLDVGNAIREKAPNATTALSRLKEAREYIRENVIASFEKLRNAGARFSGNQVSRIVALALKDAFDVFSGYAE